MVHEEFGLLVFDRARGVEQSSHTESHPSAMICIALCIVCSYRKLFGITLVLFYLVTVKTKHVWIRAKTCLLLKL